MAKWRRSLGIVIAAAICVAAFSGCPSKQRYVNYIERVSATPEELALIITAENYLPPREDVLAVFNYERYEPPESGLWWYTGFSGVLIPYAITGGAIDYYAGLVDEAQALLESGGSPSWDSIVFRYKAGVAWYTQYEMGEEVFENVNVVTMTAKWTGDCGIQCGMLIEASRTVVIGEDGATILAVVGDGEANAYVI